MGLHQRLELRQGQSLVMTPQLLQAIKLLQLSHLDLATYVDAELERNPLLERGDHDGPEDAAASSPDGADRDGAAGEEGSHPAEVAPERGEIDHGHDAPLDNVFPDDSAPPKPAGEADGLNLQPSSWSNVGPGGSFDGDPPDFENRLTADLSLHDHLRAQLDLATTDPVERLVGRFLIDAVDEAGYLSETVEAGAARR